MAAIPKTFGQGGAHLTSGGSSGEPSLDKILRDIATDLNTINNSNSGVATPITSSALPAFSDPPTASQMEALRTLVNQMRQHLIGGSSGGAGASLLTTIG